MYLYQINGPLVKKKRYITCQSFFCRFEDKPGNQAIEGRQRKLGDNHTDTWQSKNDLAVLYKDQVDYTKKEWLFLDATEGRLFKLGDTHPHTLESLNTLIELYEAWNKPEEAEKWRAELPQMEPVNQ